MIWKVIEQIDGRATAKGKRRTPRKATSVLFYFPHFPHFVPKGLRGAGPLYSFIVSCTHGSTPPSMGDQSAGRPQEARLVGRATAKGKRRTPRKATSVLFYFPHFPHFVPKGLRGAGPLHSFIVSCTHGSTPPSMGDQSAGRPHEARLVGRATAEGKRRIPRKATSVLFYFPHFPAS